MCWDQKQQLQALALQPAVWGISCLVLLPSPCNDSSLYVSFNNNSKVTAVTTTKQINRSKSNDNLEFLCVLTMRSIPLPILNSCARLLALLTKFDWIFGSDRPIWLFWGRYQYIGHSWADTDISKIFKSCFLLHYQKYDVFYAIPFFSKTSKIMIYELKFLKLQQFQYLMNLLA